MGIVSRWCQATLEGALVWPSASHITSPSKKHRHDTSWQSKRLNNNIKRVCFVRLSHFRAFPPSPSGHVEFSNEFLIRNLNVSGCVLWVSLLSADSLAMYSKGWHRDDGIPKGAFQQNFLQFMFKYIERQKRKSRWEYPRKSSLSYIPNLAACHFNPIDGGFCDVEDRQHKL